MEPAVESVEPVSKLVSIDLSQKNSDELLELISNVIGEIRELECVICQKPLYSENEYTTKCSHTFHKSCMYEWRIVCMGHPKITTCPSCREPLFNRNGREISSSRNVTTGPAAEAFVINFDFTQPIQRPDVEELTLDSVPSEQPRSTFSVHRIPLPSEESFIMPSLLNSRELLSQYFANEMGQTNRQPSERAQNLISRIMRDDFV